MSALDPIRAALERLTTMASDELATTRQWAHTRQRWDDAIAAASAALDAAPPSPAAGAGGMSAPESIAAVLQRLAKAAEGVADVDPIGALHIAAALADLADLTAAPETAQPTAELSELISELQRICLDVAPCDADTIERAIAWLRGRAGQP